MSWGGPMGIWNAEVIAGRYNDESYKNREESRYLRKSIDRHTETIQTENVLKQEELNLRQNELLIEQQKVLLEQKKLEVEELALKVELRKLELGIPQNTLSKEEIVENSKVINGEPLSVAFKKPHSKVIKINFGNTK